MSDRVPATVVGVYDGEIVFAWVWATSTGDAWNRAVRLTFPGQQPDGLDLDGNAYYSGICFAVFDGHLPQGFGELMPDCFVQEVDMVSIADGDGEVECPTCGADVGQQCSDQDGTEFAGLVHVARQCGER